MLLDKVNFPQDIKGFSEKELKELCSEIRSYMVECCSKNPGHLGSSLGAVELIVALHYIYNTPFDKLLFDVSHQAYAHKILTGRKEQFKTLRTFGGLSGFTRREESPYDPFVAGHASTSISAALGFATAASLTGSGEKVVAVIGDGALAGGLAFEGLNNAGASSSDILIVLNDNNISISPNIGGLHNYLLDITTHPMYNRVKNKVWNTLGDKKFRHWIQALVKRLKSNLVRKYKGDFFEQLGFRYFGPIDGNDIKVLTKTLGKLSKISGPKVLHIITTKGKGYSPAEEDPVVWHAPGKFDPETGEIIKKNSSVARYQDVFGQTLTELAELDEKVVGITPAMLTGCSMDVMAEKFPSRVFDVGIEEEHAVTFSAGLAAAGLKPFCNIYSSFAQRAYDQIIHDVALQKLPVVLCFDRAGIVGEDGPTHHGAFDLAAFRSIPSTIIAAPSDELELRNMMYTAYKYDEGPFIIRYPRGGGVGATWQGAEFEEVAVGRGRKVFEAGLEAAGFEGEVVGGVSSMVAIVALGPLVHNAIAVAERVGGVDVYDMRFLKPFDSKLISYILTHYKKVITLEDGTLKGGLYSEVLELRETLFRHSEAVYAHRHSDGSIATEESHCHSEPVEEYNRHSDGSTATEESHCHSEPVEESCATPDPSLRCTLHQDDEGHSVEATQDNDGSFRHSEAVYAHRHSEGSTATEESRATVIGLGLPDSFVPHGSVAELQKLCGIDVDSITDILSV